MMKLPKEVGSSKELDKRTSLYKDGSNYNSIYNKGSRQILQDCVYKKIVEA